jgi:formylglycine-generating enzyme required for sulfatase activity
MVATAAVLGVVLWTNRTPAIPGMVYFPSGSFLAGPDKKPAEVGAFYLDQTEVSNGEFAEFCRVTGCQPPVGDPGLPVVNVTVAQARAYAQWRGKRLPTQLEWERVVRSVDGVKYPWGDADDPGLANVLDNPILKDHVPMPVRSFRPLPAYQLIGNVWEMVEGEVVPDEITVGLFANYLAPAPTAQEKWIQIRGGSFTTPLRDSVAYRYRVIPERYSSGEIGFRCAKSRE